MIAALAGFGLLFAIDQKEPGMAGFVFVGFSRAGILASFLLLFQSHPTLFPTLFAATSMGIVNFITRIIVIMAPLIAEAAYPLPEIVIVILQVIMAFAVLFLVEPSIPRPNDAKRE